MHSAQDQSSPAGTPRPALGLANLFGSLALLAGVLLAGCGSQAETGSESEPTSEDAAGAGDAHGPDSSPETIGSAAPVVESGSPTTPNGGDAIRFGVAKLEVVDGSDGHVEFGEVYEGLKLLHTFRLRATGEVPSEIRKLKPSCKCTRGKAFSIDESGQRHPYKDGQPIPVGSEVEVDLIISTEGEHGELRTSLDVLTNGKDGRVRLTMRTYPKGVFEVEEGERLFFGQVSVGRRVERSLRFWSDHLEPFQVRVDETQTAPELELTLTPIGVDPGEPSRRWELRAALGPLDKIGFKNYPVHLLTDVSIPWPKYPSRGGEYGLSFQGQADVVHPLQIEPAALAFGEVAAGDVVERVARITVVDPDFILKDEFTPRWVVRKGPDGLADMLNVDVQVLEEGRAMEVRIGFDPVPEGHSGRFVGRLELDVGHEHMPTVKVRCSGVFGE